MDDQNQASRASAFRALHERGTFVIANCWDGGSARILQSLGFPALATSSGAAAGTYGRLDGQISLDEALAHAKVICSATSLPVSADLEKGFGDGPDATAKAIRFAADGNDVPNLARCNVEHARGADVFVGDEELFAVMTQRELFGIGADGKFAEKLFRRDVHEPDAVGGVVEPLRVAGPRERFAAVDADRLEHAVADHEAVVER